MSVLLSIHEDGSMNLFGIKYDSYNLNNLNEIHKIFKETILEKKPKIDKK